MVIKNILIILLFSLSSFDIFAEDIIRNNQPYNSNAVKFDTIICSAHPNRRTAGLCFNDAAGYSYSNSFYSPRDYAKKLGYNKVHSVEAFMDNGIVHYKMTVE
jgi:hypothetical protein